MGNTVPRVGFESTPLAFSQCATITPHRLPDGTSILLFTFLYGFLPQKSVQTTIYIYTPQTEILPHLTPLPPHSHPHTYTHIHSPTPHIPICTRTQTSTHQLTYAYSPTHLDSHTHISIHTRTHSYIHTHLHILTHTPRCTHPHTHPHITTYPLVAYQLGARHYQDGTRTGLAQFQDNVIEWDSRSWCWWPGFPVGQHYKALMGRCCSVCGKKLIKDPFLLIGLPVGNTIKSPPVHSVTSRHMSWQTVHVARM